MERRKRRLPWIQLIFLAFGVVALLGFAPQAFAQDEDEGEAAGEDAAEEAPAEAPAEPPPPPPPPAPEPAAAAAEEEAAEKKEVEEIVVTGSMIRRKDLTTPAPVAVIGKLEMDASGMVSIGDILQNLPSQSNAINLQVNNGGTGATRINLRALGAHRTLVLLNGRRMVYAGLGADASVDLNSIPTGVIERIEVLKDGASSIYGSDAIGGVVNIITRKDFTGVDTSAYVGTSTYGDGLVYDLNVTAGHKSDKGSLLFSAGVYENKPVWCGDRDYAKADWMADNWDPDQDPTICETYGKMVGDVCIYQGGSSSTLEGHIIDRSGAPGNQLWNDLVAQYPDGDYYRNPDNGLWEPMNYQGTTDACPGTFCGTLYNYQPRNYLYTPQKRYHVFAMGGYDFNDYVRGFFEATFVNRYSQQKLAPEPLFTISEGITVSADNAYNPFGRDFIDVRRRLIEFNNRIFTQDVDTFRASLGLEGDFPEGWGPFSSWHWELGYLWGRTAAVEMQEGNLHRSRLAQALGPSYWDGNQWRCGTAANPGDADCVPLNVFGGEGTINQSMVNYVGWKGANRGFSDLEGVRFAIGGPLYELPFGGPIGIALGYEYREEFGGQIPNPLVAKGETTGNKGEATEGGYFVNEAFGELVINLLADMPGVELFELSASGRYSSYSNFGSAFTWKAGARWQILQDVAIRGTFSTAFRAPSIGQLFSGNYDDFPLVHDPCDSLSEIYQNNPNTVQVNCAADGIPDTYVNPDDQQRARRGGNQDLDPETANILTAGIVFQPTFLEGLTTTVDFWMLEIKDSIQTIGPDIILSGCYLNDPSNRQFCDLVLRRPSHTIDYIVDTAANVGALETWGIDMQIRYDMKSPVGRFLFNLEGTYTGQYDQINKAIPEKTDDGEDNPSYRIAGVGVYDLELALPEWRFNFGIIWGLDDIGAGVNVRYFGSFKECEDNDCHTPRTDSDGNPREVWGRTVDMNLTLDLFVSYSIDSTLGKTTITLGCNNLLDADPEAIYNGFTATSDPTAYDFMGRFVYMRLGQTF